MIRIASSLFNPKEIFRLQPVTIQAPYHRQDKKDYQSGISITSIRGLTVVERVSESIMTKEEAEAYANTRLAGYELELKNHRD